MTHSFPSGPAPALSNILNVARGLKFNKDLEAVAAGIGGKQTRRILQARDKKKNYLPGQPRIRLGDGLLAYLTESHTTDELDELLPFMRYIFVQTPSYDHIKPLHHQGSHERKIKVSENPGLHLVWYHELIFIKPIPAYFYSPDFWEYLENADAEAEAATAATKKHKPLYSACVGFMRSYYMLIKYEIDFQQACDLRLIPKKGNGQLPTYEEWCEFMVPFSQASDDLVSRRYHYGELRLTRINNAAFFRKGSLAYFHIYPQWGSFLKHTLAPIVTVFAVSSVILNAMQVGLAAVTMLQTAPDGLWPKFVAASIWFSVVIMITIAAGLVAALLGIIIMGVKDLVRGNVVRRQKKTTKDGDARPAALSHGLTW
ncbi:hypothetical protein C8A05DRAFT_19833 [Staphylotrichum tortipilum]|uniref:Uncharacterized protein n=1 Tax=Staphylotrichum tortipilum TaxID=2831512 RepID=A0AAN6RNP8_9PEZI|nr:hypothetical protein C8A05DRAFT_19833 [Staphylotrichum longicolle]